VQRLHQRDDNTDQLTHNGLQLRKKSRLNGRILRVAKVAQTYANHTIPIKAYCVLPISITAGKAKSHDLH
jgi:hypothetical protein